MKIWFIAFLTTFSSFAPFWGNQLVGQPAKNDPKKPPPYEGMRWDLNESGDQFLRITFLNQVWFRYTENNPGSTLFGHPEDNAFDIGLRRTRIQMYGKVSPRLFVYTQFGINNFQPHSPRKTGLFFHDANADFEVVSQKLFVGGGLTGWNGVSRYSSPSVGSILSADAPLYQQATNDATDQFLRKLSVYAKGKLGKIGYMVALSDPMAIQNSNQFTTEIGSVATYSHLPGKMQFHGYFTYEFFDSEPNQMAYRPGTYLGQKEVLTLGFGFLTQQDAMWYLGNQGIDTLFSNLTLLNVDLFAETPIDKRKGNAITLYFSAGFTDYGKNFVRNLGVMNSANGTNTDASFNGAGNAFPMSGTGAVFYAQAGYLTGKKTLGKAGTLQPFATAQYARFEQLGDPMLMYELGLNWLIEGQRAKLSFNYQNRPVYNSDALGELRVSERLGMYVVQFQVSI